MIEKNNESDYETMLERAYPELKKSICKLRSNGYTVNIENCAGAGIHISVSGMNFCIQQEVVRNAFMSFAATKPSILKVTIEDK